MIGYARSLIASTVSNRMAQQRFSMRLAQIVRSIAQHGQTGKNSLDYYAATVYGTVYMGDGYLEVGLAGLFNDIENKRQGLSHYLSNSMLGKLGAYF